MQKQKKEEKKFWFKAKCYGWGWYPSSWEGFLVLLAWFVLFMLSLILMDHEWLKNMVVIFIITSILIWICYKKGEKPRWRWGR